MGASNLAPSIIWGTCWYNESADTIIKYVNETQNVLTKLNVRFSFIVFDANINRDLQEREYVKEKITGLVFACKENRYPNKNLGVSIITEIAYIFKSDILAIVDPDWKILSFESFVSGLLTPIINGKVDVVIPDIESYAGRDNKLIGSPILRLFFPDLSKTIRTPFPGAFAGMTEKIHKITSSCDYHYDWGGEWDLVAGGEKARLRVASPALGMKATRHRSSYSKTGDAHQIWRAFFQGIDFVKMYKIANLYQLSDTQLHAETLFPYRQLHGCATQQLDVFMELEKHINVSPAICQLLNMVLLPLSLILDANDTSKNYAIPDDDVSAPYDRNELNVVSQIAEYSIVQALRYSKLPLSDISAHAKALSGGFMGEWSLKDSNFVREKTMCQIKGVCLKWT